MKAFTVAAYQFIVAWLSSNVCEKESLPVCSGRKAISLEGSASLVQEICRAKMPTVTERLGLVNASGNAGERPVSGS